MFGLARKPVSTPELNALSVRRVPVTMLPGWELRHRLSSLALAGADIYAYQPVGDPDAWNLWCYGMRFALPDDTAIRARLAGREGGR